MGDNVIVLILLFSFLIMHHYTKCLRMFRLLRRDPKCFQAAALNERLPRMWIFFINVLNRSFKALSSYIFMSKDHINPNRSWVIFYKNVGEDVLQYDHLFSHLRYIPAKLSIKWKLFISKHIEFYIKASFIYGFRKLWLKGKCQFCF